MKIRLLLKHLLLMALMLSASALACSLSQAEDDIKEAATMVAHANELKEDAEAATTEIARQAAKFRESIGPLITAVAKIIKPNNIGEETPEPPKLGDPGRLVIGQRAVVQNAGGSRLMCRDEPGGNNILDRLYEETVVDVIDGPISKDDYIWWQVKTPTSTICWAAGEWLYPVQISICQPSDPLWEDQWNMRAVHLEGALNEFHECVPASVKIAIIDTGCDLSHPDLAGRIYSSQTSIGESAEDSNGHGTHVAGIIGAIPNNDIGIAGIHPNAGLLIYKFSDKLGVDLNIFRENEVIRIADYIKSAVDNGAKVINISLGAPYDVRRPLITSLEPALPCYPHNEPCNGAMEEAIKYAHDKNVVIVAGSGNDGKDGYYYPAAYAAKYSNVIAVAASTSSNELAAYSTTGPWVTVSAPGGVPTFLPGSKKFECLLGIDDCILSLSLERRLLVRGYAELQGTSQAAPHVAGVVALMISMNQSLSPSDIRDAIGRTASKFHSEPSRQAGAGIVNAELAVKESRP